MAPPNSVAAQHKGKLEKDDPTLLPSDDDDDSDFHLSDAGDAGSDSGDDSDDDNDAAQPAAKRAKLADEAKPALDKAAVDDLWAAFNDPSAADPYAPSTSTSSNAAAAPPASAAAASSSSTGTSKSTVDVKGKGKRADDDLVEIEVEYGFAGEWIKQKKRVPRSSIEAQAYFATHGPPPSSASSSSVKPIPAAAASAAPQDPTTASLDALFGPSSSSADPPAASSSSTAPSAAPGPAPAPSRAPPKRKAGGGLAGMAATLGVGKKPAKLNTLEKSKLDWDSYVSTQEGLSDTLTHARKDGYLDRRDFLDRVEDAKERQWDESKSRRR
ncbi:hypothetical protein JCM9279_000806 [Rhodotorula babjevae]